MLDAIFGNARKSREAASLKTIVDEELKNAINSHYSSLGENIDSIIFLREQVFYIDPSNRPLVSKEKFDPENHDGTLLLEYSVNPAEQEVSFKVYDPTLKPVLEKVSNGLYGSFPNLDVMIKEHYKTQTNE